MRVVIAEDNALLREGLVLLLTSAAEGATRGYYTALPGYLQLFDVALIPFVLNDITLATSPLKLFEYFAGGKPVITTPLPECKVFPEVNIVRDAREFAEALDAYLHRQDTLTLPTTAPSSPPDLDVHLAAEVLHLSARTGEGMGAWYGWIEARRREAEGT